LSLQGGNKKKESEEYCFAGGRHRWLI